MRDARGTSDLPLRTRLTLFAGGSVIRALAVTWRYRTVDEECVVRLRSQKTPILFALWHGHMLPLLWYHRGQGVRVLVSEHRDGEVIAQILEQMGYGLVRGSTSRGAGRALLGVVRALKDGSGSDVAITPDGPRGPKNKFAPGAVIAAHRSGAPIVPALAYVDRFWKLSTWDGFIIPKPFARITLAYGPPTFVAADTPREAAEEAPRLERLMDDAYRKACA